ncbi:FxSxx-COOH system tetratricopeptide repeat protein [Kitasatospora sp. A2-31]|uniref:FxSxx-COOH system tetratricopeptide repeat protein n=1 Tax=Kitasatospora sp. A2-31 TaxID=2916414 RepID=UPI001EEB74B6|nr:FxSxx-COOH system tetratricopeptide repeat protein [Kitasatospora sp. A2-31]MCG6495394.1 FxSxx-COOH system tetratricopeptide repeat protein [Kitasatospora sp. A2-31]
MYVHGGRAGAAPAVDWPVQVGTVPLLADCFRHRAAVEGSFAVPGSGAADGTLPADGRASTGARRPVDSLRSVVLSGPAGVGKTQAAVHHVQLALRTGAVDLVVWADASSADAIRHAYGLAADRLGLGGVADVGANGGIGRAEADRRLMTWLNTTDRRWLIVLDGLADPADLAGLWPAPSASGLVLVTTRRADRGLRTSRRRLVPVGAFTAAEAADYLADRLAVHDLSAPGAELRGLAAHHGCLPAGLADAAGRLVADPGAVPWLRPLQAGAQARRSAECALCRLSTEGTTVAVRHAPEDALWARWTEAVLRRAGLRVLPDTADRTVALLSPAFLRASRGSGGTSAADGSGAPAPGPSTVGPSAGPGPAWDLAPGAAVAVRIEPTPVEGPVIDLVGLGPEPAAAALLAAVGGAPRAPDLTGLRHPGSVPAHFKVPPRHPSFTGRRTVLEHLHRQLGAGVAAVLPTSQTLYGLGGIGKTQLALEYAHRYRADYDLIWWIDAEQTESVLLALAGLARRLGLPVGDSVAEAAEAAREALGRGNPSDRWLLVFDNADEPAEIRRFFPDGPGRVLVTSRNLGWTRAASALEVDVFTREESTDHLRRRVRGIATADAHAVADALGDLPLAVEVAAAWLDATAMPVAAYLTRLEQALSTEGAFDYPRSVAAAWGVSIERLRDRSPAAVRLLQLCAYCAPEPISAGLLYGEEMVAALAEFDPAATDAFAVAAAVRALGRYSLVRVDAEAGRLQLHRLVQAVVRSEVEGDGGQLRAKHTVHRILSRARPAVGDTDDPANWPAFEEIWPHLYPSEAHLCDEPETRTLLIDRVRYLWKRGELSQALSLGRSLDEDWTRKLGGDDRQTLLLRFQLANVLRTQGRYAEALSLDEATLERQRTLLDERHPDALQTAGSLGADFRALGRFEAALELDRATLRHSADLFGDVHPRTLAMANNLAIDHRLVGDSEAARVLDRENLARRTVVLGPRHPYTLSTKTCLARDLHELGHHEPAIGLLREAMADLDAVLEPDLPEHLRNTTLLGAALRRSGLPEEGGRLTRDAYERYVQRYGFDTPDGLVCLLSRAADLSVAGDQEAARDLAARVHTAYRRMFGDEHPFTLACADNVAVYLRRAGDPRAAVREGRAVLEALTGAVGAAHPFTLTAAANLANALADEGCWEEAEQLHRTAVEGLRDRYGPDHHDVLITAADRALTVLRRGADPNGAEAHRHAVAALARLLGEDHPETRAARGLRPLDRELETQPI